MSRAIDRQACGEFIRKLENKSPEGLVEASRDKSAPTHDYFEWDDPKAAKKLERADTSLAEILRQAEIMRGHPLTCAESDEAKAAAVYREIQARDLFENEGLRWIEPWVFRIGPEGGQA